MALALDEKDQLAGPSRLETVSPPLFDPKDSKPLTRSDASVPVVDLVPDSLLEPEPSFLRQARALATENDFSAMAHARLAQAAMAAGEQDQAVEMARRALLAAKEETGEGGTTDESAVFSAARTLMACGLLEEAEEALLGLELGGPALVLSASLAAQRGELDVAFQRLDDDQSVDAWDLRGWIALSECHFDQAIRFYRRAMRKGGPSPALLANMGLAHAAVGAQEQAITETRQALALGPAQKQRVVFNLVAYLVANGRSEDAMHQLRCLQDEFPEDIEPAFAEAHWRLAIGDAERAERRLRTARDTLRDGASEVQRAELAANLSYLAWYRNSKSRADAAKEVLQQLRGIEWKSPRLGAMVPVLLCRYSELPRLREASAALARANPGHRFYSVEIQKAILSDEMGAATKLAVEWAEREIFAPEAVMAATFMLIDVEDRFDQAADLGTRALRRMPAAYYLENNIAYALALSGQPERARRVIGLGDDSSLYHLATKGLITAWMGDVAAGLRMYDQAEDRARLSGLSEAAAFVALSRRLVGLVPAETRGFQLDKPVLLPPDWANNPYYVMRLRMLKRRGASLANISVEGEDGELESKL